MPIRHTSANTMTSTTPANAVTCRSPALHDQPRQEAGDDANRNSAYLGSLIDAASLQKRRREEDCRELGESEGCRVAPLTLIHRRVVVDFETRTHNQQPSARPRAVQITKGFCRKVIVHANRDEEHAVRRHPDRRLVKM